MRFFIGRTSDGLIGKDKPCEKARLTTITQDDGAISVVWTIELSSLEELLDLYAEVGRLIINGSTFDWDNGKDLDGPAIEIYDNYRE